ncbi:MAG: hypothetical protein Q9216_006424 [Gyalolechia sp. 2 TL-2023]
MRAARPDPPRWTYDNLVHNGWKIEDGDPYDLGPEALKAMNALKIPTEKEKNLEITAVLENKFPNFQQNIQVGSNLIDSPFENATSDMNRGDYSELYNVDGHAIIGLYNYSPSYYAKQALGTAEHPLEGDALRAVIPNLHTWADIVWSIWAKAAGDKAGDLRYVLQYDIVTLSTQYVIESIEGHLKEGEVSRSLDLPWPGHTYNLMDDRGLALLGCSHGVGIAWLYRNGRKALGVRDHITVTIFTGPSRQRSQYNQYYLLWDLGAPLR